MLEGIIYYKYRIYLVPGSGFKQKVLKIAHDSPLAVHHFLFKTYIMLRERFSWKGLKNDVLNYVNEFPTCQQNKVDRNHPSSLLQPFPIPKQKWESISMDFITCLPKVLGKDCILVVVDRITQLSHLFSITITFTATQVVELFFKEVFRLHGLPRRIFSDRDSKFLVHFGKNSSK